MSQIMEKPCLNDKNIYPDDQVLGGFLGETKNIWDIFINLLKQHPLFSTEWRYYKLPKRKKQFAGFRFTKSILKQLSILQIRLKT